MKSPPERRIDGNLAMIFTLLGILIGGLAVVLVYQRFNTTMVSEQAQAPEIVVVFPTATNTPWWEATPSATATRTPRPTVVPENVWPDSVSAYVGGSIDQALLSPTATKQSIEWCSYYERAPEMGTPGVTRCKNDLVPEMTPTPVTCLEAKNGVNCVWRYGEE